MRATGALILILAALTATSGAFAEQSGSADNSRTIVVQGRRGPPERVAAQFVERRAGHTRIGQIARWRDPVCPSVRNLPKNFARYMEARIRAVAQKVGAPSSADCKTPSVEIIFTDNPQAIMDHVASESPILLGFHYQPQKRTLATVTLPIQAWYVTATTNGTAIVIDDPMEQPPPGSAGSRLSHGLEALIVHVLILVDSKLSTGAPVGPVSDYLAMVALAQINPETSGCPDPPSILHLYDPDCSDDAKPQALTTSDEGYLRGLYTMPLSAIIDLQKSHIARRVLGDQKAH